MKEHLQKKFALLDTCFIARAKDYSDSSYFDAFFDTLTLYGCVPVIHDLIRFEFFRGCKTVAHQRSKEAVLKRLAIEVLPVRTEHIEQATRIANAYSHCNIPPTTIGPVDCINSAFLEKFCNNLVLVTLDNGDYPLFCHDRFHVEVIDTGKELINLGFYKFNENGLREKWDGFHQTSDKTG